jgi:hypothetical protein
MPGEVDGPKKPDEHGSEAAAATPAHAAAPAASAAPRRTPYHDEAIQLLMRFGGDVWALAHHLLVIDLSFESDLWHEIQTLAGNAFAADLKTKTIALEMDSEARPEPRPAQPKAGTFAGQKGEGTYKKGEDNKWHAEGYVTSETAGMSGATAVRGHGTEHYEGEERSATFSPMMSNLNRGGQAKTRYMDESARAGYEVGTKTVTDDKGKQETLLTDASGKLLDTSGAQNTLKGAEGGRNIFAMSTSGQIYSGDAMGEMRKGYAAYAGGAKDDFELFHHTSFLAGGEAAAAGDIGVKDGHLKSISNASGHYQPKLETTVQALQQFQSRGVDTNNTMVDFHMGDGQGRSAAGEVMQAGGDTAKLTAKKNALHELTTAAGTDPKGEKDPTAMGADLLANIAKSKNLPGVQDALNLAGQAIEWAKTGNAQVPDDDKFHMIRSNLELAISELEIDPSAAKTAKQWDALGKRAKELKDIANESFRELEAIVKQPVHPPVAMADARMVHGELLAFEHEAARKGAAGAALAREAQTGRASIEQLVAETKETRRWDAVLARATELFALLHGLRTRLDAVPADGAVAASASASASPSAAVGTPPAAAAHAT